MSEGRFVADLQKSAKMQYENVFVWKTNDRFSLGIPDLLIIIDGETYAMEVKYTTLASAVSTCRPGDPDTVKCLNHTFSGTQISVLRQIQRAGAHAMGIIGIPGGVAYLVDPLKIPKGGNFTMNQMEALCVRVSKEDGFWRIREWPTKISCHLEKKTPQ